MKKTKKNYIPFIAGMATMILLACLISASLAKEDPPAAQPQSADPRIACGEAGIALFGTEYAAPGETLKTRQGAEVPKVLTYTDGKGEVHYYVEAETIADILDVSIGAEYNEALNCVDFGSQYLRDEQGELLLKETDDGTGEKIWWTSEPPCDFNINQFVINGKSIWVTAGTVVTSDSSSAVVVPNFPKTPEELEQENARWAETVKSTPLKPRCGVSAGMFTEADPAEMDPGSWSGTAMKDQLFESSDGKLEHTFAFTPYLGEYAAITIENTGATDVQITVKRPCTVGSHSEGFDTVRLPAGGKLTRAFRIDENLPLENRLTLYARAMAADTPVRVKLTAEQYRFGK